VPFEGMRASSVIIFLQRHWKTVAVNNSRVTTVCLASSVSIDDCAVTATAIADWRSRAKNLAQQLETIWLRKSI
jgi:hypothetical protein